MPGFLGHVDVEMLRGLLDIGEGEVALVIADVVHLIESGEGVADVGGICQRFLPLLGERKNAVGKIVSLGGVEFAMHLVRTPGRLVVSVSSCT